MKVLNLGKGCEGECATFTLSMRSVITREISGHVELVPLRLPVQRLMNWNVRNNQSPDPCRQTEVRDGGFVMTVRCQPQAYVPHTYINITEVPGPGM